MNYTDLFFYIVLFSQIMFLSYYYPKRMLIRIHTIFKNYIKNQKTDFRMMNRNAYNFLGRKYIANKLKTFENTNDYEECLSCQ